MINSADTTPAIICPQLGLKGDPSSSVSYPSGGNFCFHCPRPTSPLPLHQKMYCLSENYDQCPVFIQSEKDSYPPHQIGASGPFLFEDYPYARKLALFTSIVCIILVAVIFYFFWGTNRFNFAQVVPTAVITEKTATPVPQVDLVILVPSVIPLTKFPSPVPSITPTFLPEPLHALESPIRVDEHTYIIHFVKAGQGFDYFINKYNTTPDVIRALNFKMPAGIWVKKPIVISPGMTSVDPTLPEFEVYLVTDDKISIDDLAIKLAIDSDLFKKFNGCRAGCTVKKDDYLLIPHMY